jgi:myo-inositol-1(or 4)-monophosphatase
MIEVAVAAVKKAGCLLKRNLGRINTPSLKSYKDFVTRLDLVSEQTILSFLSRHFPEYNFVSEEAGIKDNHSRYTWIIDPLCSTNNFVFGLPFYGLSTALLLKGRPILGVIYIPQLNYLFTAQKNKGAYLNGKRIRVSLRKNLREAMILYDNQFYKDKAMYRNLRHLINASFTVRILGSAAFDLGLVAAGKADARIFHKTKPCDFMAGGLIVEEAGGCVTNFQGARFSLRDSAIVASNKFIHRQILRLLG